MKMIALFVADKNFNKFAVIQGIFKNLLLLVSSGDHVKEGAFVFNTWFPSHVRE
jgi:hypothetical protein